MIVTVKQGSLRGTSLQSILNGQTYYGFLRIPYAKPPVGKLRFREPQPLEKWDGVLDATVEGDICIQQDTIISQLITGSEDCLFLNVFTPEPPEENKSPKPVMVFFHGGAFYVGSGSARFSSPDLLIVNDVIVVTVNYRLHIFGFLNLELPECPGNVGLKDQVLALKWVQENIVHFGGDPNNVTIFGQSAGAASVQYHMISPLSKGLFTRGIMQSGICLSKWAFTKKYLESAFEVGELLGYYGNCVEELYAVLMRSSSKQLTEAVFQLHTNTVKTRPCSLILFNFLPSVESIKEGAFLPSPPHEMVKHATLVPLIVGVNSQEGLLITIKETMDYKLRMLQRDFELFVRSNLEVSQDQIPEVANRIRKFYFGDKPINFRTVNKAIDLYSDVGYNCSLYQTIQYMQTHQSSSPVYCYFFKHDGKRNLFKSFVKSSLPVPIEGATHGDELGYLFYIKVFPEVVYYNSADVTVSHNMCSMWTNFAKTGDPNDSTLPIQWKPTTRDDPSYLEIDKRLNIKEGYIAEDRVIFWESLLKSLNDN